MDDIKNHIKYSRLLAAKILGFLSEKQKREFQEWEQQANNKEVAEVILNPQRFLDWKQKRTKLDVNREWNAFLERKDAKKKVGSKVVYWPYLKQMAAAAAIVLLGVFVYKANTSKKETPVLQTVEVITIPPGKSHAELVLSTGQVVDLEGESDYQINEEHTALTNSEGVLEYKSVAADKEIVAKTNVLRVPRGGEYQLLLSDGTKVWLNSDSELTYDVPFLGNERHVTLKGEAYFDVTPDKSKPFVVTSGEQDVEVLGTEFNISAYNDQGNIITTLVEGKVKLTQQASDNEVYLSPNEQSVYNKTNSKFKTKSVDPYAFVSWKDGRFTFKKETLESLFHTISRWYNVDVVIEDQSVKNIRFTGDLPRYNNMNSILKIIEAEMSVHIKVDDTNRKIYVSK